MRSDLHLHTKYSHGANSPREMYEAGLAKGLELMGFSEHSPRPLGFDYTHEYRDKLTECLSTYVREVTELAETSGTNASGGRVRVLFGMEMDWLEGEEEFALRSAKAFDFDYLIGSVHFIGHWGFDDGRGRWDNASQEECEVWYAAYWEAWERMVSSRLYNIAAHPDLIKIFSKEQFHHWLAGKEGRDTLRRCLTKLKEVGMAMEISSAGLRKACREIYPCPEIMSLARELDLPVSLASDAHSVKDVGFGLEELSRYARSFGFCEQVSFNHGVMSRHPLPDA